MADHHHHHQLRGVPIRGSTRLQHQSRNSASAAASRPAVRRSPRLHQPPQRGFDDHNTTRGTAAAAVIRRRPRHLQNYLDYYYSYYFFDRIQQQEETMIVNTTTYTVITSTVDDDQQQQHGGGGDGGGLSDEIIGRCLKTRKQPCLRPEPDNNNNNNNEVQVQVCGVCLEDLGQSSDSDSDIVVIGVVDCGHEFHVGCIKQWLTRKNICPLCRAIALGR